MEVGRIIDGKYRTTRLLGQGSSSVVMEAVNIATKATVVVKLFTADDIDDEMRTAFEREVQSAFNVSGMNLVRLSDSGFDGAERRPYVVMEKLRGQDLATALKRFRWLAPDVAVRIVAQACIGVGKAHYAGLVHRDLRPANLFIENDELGDVTVRVLDLGTGKLGVEHAFRKAKRGATTPLQFMSPEQGREKTIDNRADVWGLGVTLFKALTGMAPHEEKTTSDTVAAICTKPVPNVRKLAPWVDAGLAEVVYRATRIVPEERYGSCEELRMALAPFMRSQALRVEEIAFFDPREHAANAPTSQGPLSRKNAISRVAVVSVALLAAVAALGIAVPYVRRSQGDKGQPPPVFPAGSVTTTLSAPEPRANRASKDAGPASRSLRIIGEASLVTIDNAPATLHDGVVEVPGALGTEHRVVIELQGDRRAQNVLITERGVFPDEMEAPRNTTPIHNTPH